MISGRLSKSTLTSMLKAVAADPQLHVLICHRPMVNEIRKLIRSSDIGSSVLRRIHVEEFSV